MQSVRISHPEPLLFNRWMAPGETQETSGSIQSWMSPELDTPELLACVGSFDTVRSFNSLRLKLHKDLPDAFPNTFRFEISQDGVVWEPIIQESDYRAGMAIEAVWHFPLISARFIKFLLLVDRTNKEGKYQTAFGEFSTMISGIVDVNVSSELDRLWVKENIIDERPDYGWSSALRGKKQDEFLWLDLGAIHRVGEIRLLSKNDKEPLFPEVFQISYSEDNIAWHHLLEEKGFLAEPGTWYRWRFIPMNMRYVKITITESARTREGKYISQIIETEFYAAPDLIDKSEKQQQSEAIPYASVLRAGLIRLAMDGEDKEGLSVQSHDRRLRISTSESHGIVELATDGEDREGVVVQGHDKRLKYATEDLPGIVRLARDGEVRNGHAVQANDARLKYATEESSGLVELAADGENRPSVAVQGHDKRLRYATTEAPGIIKLAKPGTDLPNEAVQANDPRLRHATTEQPGILRFALSGESSPESAVQGSDARLKPATTESLGIIELARDGEESGGVVVQGNDKRLKIATETTPGIVELCTPGQHSAGRAVQGHDPRLGDPRLPLPHDHDYAPLKHPFDSHTGPLSVEGDYGASYSTIAPPPISHSPIRGENSGKGAGLVGQGTVGALGYGEESGVLGLSKEGSGVKGVSQKSEGGHFYSQSDYGIRVTQESEFGKGSGLGLKVDGLVKLNSPIVFSNTGSLSIAAYFKVEGNDVLSPGDIVLSTGKVGIVKKSKEANSTGIIGVVVKSSLLVQEPHIEGVTFSGDQQLSDGPLPQGVCLVALVGLVKVRAICEKSPIVPGDLLVSSIESGKAEKWDKNKIIPGSVFARCLGSLQKGEGLLDAVLIGGV